MIQFQDLLIREHIFFLKNVSKDEALRSLVEKLASQGTRLDEKSFCDTLFRREKLTSTAIGLGAAIPHAKMPTLDHFFLAVGIAKEGIEWGADDELPVKFIFLIGGPDNKPIEYLSLLSSLTKAIRSDDVLNKLMHAKTSDEIIKALY